MGFFDFFKKKNKIRNNGFYDEYTSDIQYNGVNIIITFDILEGKKHLYEDYKVLEKEGIDNIIKNRFISWIKADYFTDRDDDKIFDGLKVSAISYNYGRIVAEHSPTGKDDYFGQFQFDFESSTEYTSDMLEAVAMEVYVINGEIVKVSGYDI